MILEFLKFHPIKPIDSLIGYCSFKYNNDFSFNEIAVYKLRKPKNNIKIRLRYPDRIKPESKIQKEIDLEVNSYILANYINHMRQYEH